MIEHFVRHAAANGLGTIGQDLFAYDMPDECKRGLLIRPPVDGIAIDPYLPGYYSFDLRLIVRAQSIPDGDMLASMATSVFTSHQRFQLVDPTSGLPAINVNLMQPRHLPICFPRLEGSGREWSLTVLVNSTVG